MTTSERAVILARTAEEFPLLGTITKRDLLETVRLELGHEEILDGFRPYGGHLARAEAIGPILCVVSGNTPHAALQCLVRGLLVGAPVRMKLPSAGLPEVTAFQTALPASLAATITLSRVLDEAWLASPVWCVFGSDETLATLRRRAPDGVSFLAHGHKASLCLVEDDGTHRAAAPVAQDVGLFDQKGCLSAQNVYVRGDARSFAAGLAAAMQRFENAHPRGAITPAEAAAILDVRANYRFRAASDPRVALWESQASSAWTVIYEEETWFAPSCLNRVVYVKPLPGQLREVIGPIAPPIAGVGIWPPSPRLADEAAAVRPSRICPVGQMQLPPFSWHQDGTQTLAPLVRWVDFEA